MQTMNMKEQQKPCWNCGRGKMAFRNYTHVETVGKASVTDETAFAWQCPECGEVELTTEQLAGYERRAAATVLRDGRNTTGTVLKYARKALGLKQTELAQLLGCTPEHVSRAENEHTTYSQSELLAIVALLDGVEQGTEDVHARLAALREGTQRPSLHEFTVKESSASLRRAC